MNYTNKQRKKRIVDFSLIISSFLIIIGLVVFLTLKYTCISVFELISTIISLVALGFSVLSIFINRYQNENFEFKKHIINILMNRKDAILKIFDRVILAIKSQDDFNDSGVAFAFLNIPVLKKDFYEHYTVLSKIISHYKNLLLTSRIELEYITPCLQDLEYAKMNFDDCINDLIIRIFKNDLSIKEIEKMDLEYMSNIEE